MAAAVVGETLSRISTFLIDQPEQKPIEEERLEMAHIKMEAALRMSSKWQITEVPMLRWRRKLKRAAQECDSTLRHCKQRALEDEEIRRSSFPRRIARAAKSFVSSFNSRGKADVDESSSSSSSSVHIRRLERFAEGAGEFHRFVEFGGTPGRQYMFFNPLVGDLLAGKTLRYRALQGGRLYHLGMRPARFAEWRPWSGSPTRACKEYQLQVHACVFPRLWDHLCQNSQSRTYQICLRFTHGTAHLFVEKTTSKVRKSGKCKTAGSQSRVQNKKG